MGRLTFTSPRDELRAPVGLHLSSQRPDGSRAVRAEFQGARVLLALPVLQAKKARDCARRVVGKECIKRLKDSSTRSSGRKSGNQSQVLVTAQVDWLARFPNLGGGIEDNCKTQGNLRSNG